jgi:hypothetical protein
MRSFEGQFSDNRPIRRSPQEKKKLIAELRETLANMKPSAASSLRATLLARIKELELELASAPPPREPREEREHSPRRPPRDFTPRR